MTSIFYRTGIRRAAQRLMGAMAPVLVLSACATEPPEPPVQMAMPAHFSGAAGWRPASGFSRAPQGSWWKVFQDAQLNQLEVLVPKHNQSLAAQLAAYDQARAALAEARAAYAPSVSLQASSIRSHSASANPAVAAAGRSFTVDSVAASASWAPDLWGRVRLQVEAGRAARAASAATVQFTLLSLEGTVAQTYLQLRTVDAQTRLARQTVQAYQRALQFNENTYRAGVASAAAVAQARTQLLQAQASLTDLGVSRAALQDALAVLTGQAPPDFRIARAADLPPVPRIPPGLPVTLLQRRPDLAAASDKVAEANANIGVAQTAWLPNLTLSAQGGNQASRMSDLFTAPSLFWSLGPTVSALIFEGGLRRAQRASSRAAYREAVANYRQAVLTAMQQVQDNLAAERILAQEARQQEALVQAAGVSLRVAQNQYKAGIAPYTNVILAQNTAATARTAALLLRNRRYSAAVALIQALGGGWGSGTGREGRGASIAHPGATPTSAQPVSPPAAPLGPP
ncbi:MAG TPA: efflux transporter outer membrane subunit [Acidiferrobacteraceae bacterium]|nr:efflux transporter outer membrane subunit [Acidiferrobacteraceae bacterium]